MIRWTGVFALSWVFVFSGARSAAAETEGPATALPTRDATADDLLSVVDVYRLYSGSAGDHFYTASLDEAFNATRLGYTYEGVAFRCDSTGGAGTVPLYRLYSGGQGDHFYTTSAEERDVAVAAYGYTAEGVTCYVHASPAPGTCTLYRSYSGAQGDHFYTLGWSETLSATRLGYAYEGHAAYVYPTGGGCPS